MSSKPTAIVIDDSPIMRKALKIIVSQIFDVVAEGSSGDDALPLFEKFRPDIMTMDIVMPGRDGITAATEVLGRFPEATIVMCSSLSTRDKIVACQKVGVAHYLLKPFDSEKVLSVMRFVMARRAARATQGDAPGAAS
jgi:two-component system, chemotaxis family, chemotaxis protein CheY